MSSHRELMGRLYSTSSRALRRYVRRLVISNDTAEEVVQEAFLRTYENVERLATPRAFLFTTARNLASSAQRAIQSRRTDSFNDFEELAVEFTEESPEVKLLADEELRLLQGAIAQLTPQCRAAFSLRMFHDCSYKEIAERLGIAPKTVEKHIARAARETHEYLRKRIK